jgi:hypothetical protein
MLNGLGGSADFLRSSKYRYVTMSALRRTDLLTGTQYHALPLCPTFEDRPNWNQ